MAQAKKDENYVSSILGISNADGSTLSPYIDSITHRLLVNTTGEVTVTGLSDLATETTLAKIPGLSIPIHDEIVLSYTGDNLTGVVYKLATVIKATLTLSYTGDKLIGVVKS